MTTRLTADHASRLAAKAFSMIPELDRWDGVYGIPRGGVPVALALKGIAQGLRIYDHPDEFELAQRILVVDDVYDSGATLKPFLDKNLVCFVLASKVGVEELPHNVYAGTCIEDWIVFPWEGDQSNGPEDAVRRLLQFLGRNPDDPALVDTPRRMLGWLEEFQQREEIGFESTTFDGIEYGGMVLVQDVPFTSLCEHHLLPFAGRACVAYIPNVDTRKVLGLSKLARFVQHYARRPQVQERLTENVMQAVQDATGSPSVAVLVEAEHMCMSFRGPNVPGHTTTTSSASGAFREDARTREEFMLLASRRR